MTDLPLLISTLEEATGPSRELDAALMELSHFPDRRFIGCTCDCCPGGKHLDAVWVSRATGKWVTTAADGHEYTTSVDAALALIGERLPGWFWDIQRRQSAPDTFTASLYPARQSLFPKAQASAAAPALALCLALCRALQSQGETHDA